MRGFWHHSALAIARVSCGNRCCSGEGGAVGVACSTGLLIPILQPLLPPLPLSPGTILCSHRCGKGVSDMEFLAGFDPPKKSKSGWFFVAQKKNSFHASDSNFFASWWLLADSPPLWEGPLEIGLADFGPAAVQPLLASHPPGSTANP